MELIKLDDLKKWKADRIASGNCNHDDMIALGAFIDSVDVYGFAPTGQELANAMLDTIGAEE